jgi:SAM-dependent methyltransferase
MPSESRPAPRRKFRLVDDPDESWREFGRSDPYFGVLSTDRYRAGNLDAAALAEFFASGESHVEQVLEIVRGHVTAAPALGDALDFGCGVGRLALPLARHFRAVTGVDISDAYLAEAARNRDRQGLTNVEFVETIDGLAAQERRFDLVHSYIVFNHIPWLRGKKLIGALFALLRPGGVLAVHVLHRRHAGPTRRAVSWLRRNFLPLHWLINLGRGRPLREPLMQGNEYRLDELLPFLTGLGARHFHVRIETVPGGDSFAFVICMKG